MDSCAKINMVYSLSSWGVCLVDLIISVLFFFLERRIRVKHL